MQPRCVYCYKILVSGYGLTHPFWTKEIMCLSCCNNRKPCLTCERRTILLDEPSLLCKECSSLGRVTTTEQLDYLLKNCIDLLNHKTDLAFSNLLPLLSLQLATQNQLKKILAEKPSSEDICDSAHATSSSLFGLCQLKRHQHKSGIKICIFIFDTLSPLLVGAFLCHELIHALFFFSRNYFFSINKPTPRALRLNKTKPLVLEEGLCHLAAAYWLRECLQYSFSDETRIYRRAPVSLLSNLYSPVSRNQIQFWLSKLYHSKHVDFSIGFHSAMSLVKQFGWMAVIHHCVNVPSAS